jgi:hypothetical protein
VGINLVVLGFAPLNGLQRESMAQDKGNPFLLTPVRQPLPGEHTFDADDEVFTIRGNEA